ncbi:Diacylglycerol O-acyltransferase 2 [Acorus calamus]|uniref:Acyltransferase n=1 Tax=Acorus calamus TaxID=4465 RepID=A0AAV9DUZ7_ACOCL|nr:Diacylglycerol O-acyltransferase 2 [Acorus calamus]
MSMETMDDPMTEEMESTVIHSTPHSTMRSLTAIMIWLGAIHLNIALFVVVLLFCRSTSVLFLILGFFVLLSVIPVDDKSRFGQALASYVGKYAPGYFPITVHIEDVKALDPNKSYVLAAEPHSIFPIGCLSLMSITGLLPLSKTKALASSAVFYTPILRQTGTWLGLTVATKENFINYLKAGYSCVVTPGGVQEILYMNHDSEVAFLKKRYGFVRVAIQTGSSIVPVFCFGQRDVYKWWKPKGKLYLWLARAIRFAPLVFWGAFGSPIPYCKPMHVVVGRPIRVNENPNPSDEEVVELHAQYVSALEKLFLKYRKVSGFSDMELSII